MFVNALELIILDDQRGSTVDCFLMEDTFKMVDLKKSKDNNFHALLRDEVKFN